MPHIADHSELVAPQTAIAALLLVAICQLKRFNLPHPGASEVLATCNVSRARAYELKSRLESHLGELVGPNGRPLNPPAELAPQEIATQLLAYIYEHPGAVSGLQRHRYSQGFRLFVLELIEAYPDLDREAFARTISLPLPTLTDWLKDGTVRVKPEQDELPQPTVLTVKETQIATVLDEYKRWNGDFASFCNHLQQNLHLPFGRTAISTILGACGARTPKTRPGRSSDESALRESFETFFPNAQWVGDGTDLAITINGIRHVCNLEMIVDPCSGAFLGVNIRPNEDAKAVLEAFKDAHKNTEAIPIGLLLDNKPSNHCPEVVDALDPTIIIRATPFRPQNKAHAEGGFGLLKPTLGKLNINASTPDQLASAILAVMVTVWGRTINHRPRRDRGGSSRFQLLQHEPTPEEIEHARKSIELLVRRQELARQTRAARQDPTVRAFVSDALSRLQLDDPKGYFLSAISGYPLDAIVDAVAIFEGRQRTGTLPDGVDVRYLLGITRHTAQDREAWAIMVALWEERLRAGDLVERFLQEQREHLDSLHSTCEDAVVDYVHKAVTSPWLPERFFWLTALADVITQQPDTHHRKLYLRAARCIQAAYQLAYRERQTAIRFLSSKVMPLR